MDTALLSSLRCPVCAPHGKGHLEQTGSGALLCQDCGASYPVRDGIPVLVTREGDFLHILDREGLTNE